MVGHDVPDALAAAEKPAVRDSWGKRLQLRSRVNTLKGAPYLPSRGRERVPAEVREQEDPRVGVGRQDRGIVGPLDPGCRILRVSAEPLAMARHTASGISLWNYHNSRGQTQAKWCTIDILIPVTR